MKFFTAPLLALSVMLAALPSAVLGQDPQIVFDAEHNRTSIVGTWASGSRQVQTGPVHLSLYYYFATRPTDRYGLFLPLF